MTRQSSVRASTMNTYSFIIIMLVVSYSNSALDKKNAFLSWTVQKLQGLETALQKLGCQHYFAKGYRYEKFYPVDGLEFDNVIVKKTQGELRYFEMHLAIKTSKDAIILLSPTESPRAKDMVFEIGVGIFSNQFTILRLLQDSKDGEVMRISTPNILSTSRYTNFYLIISDDKLTFGKEGEEPIISYYDPKLLTVKYFGMSSWGTAQAKFLYDCLKPSDMYCYYKSE